MTRRRFIFWLSFGLFSLAEKFRVDGLDRLAAATMRLAEPATGGTLDSAPEHWTAAENNTWHWYERENFVAGEMEVDRHYDAAQ